MADLEKFASRVRQEAESLMMMSIEATAAGKEDQAHDWMIMAATMSGVYACLMDVLTPETVAKAEVA